MRGRSAWLVLAGLFAVATPVLSEEPKLPPPVEVVAGLGDWLEALACAPDGKSLVVADEKHVLRVVELSSGRTVRTLKGLKHRVQSLAFPAGDCDVLVSMGSGGDRSSGKSVLRLWQWSTGGVRMDIDTSSAEGIEERACEVAVSPATRDIAVSYRSLKLRVLDARRVRAPVEIQGGDKFIASRMAFSPDGLSLATIDQGLDREATVRVYRRADETDKWVRLAQFVDDKVVPDPKSMQWFGWSNLLLTARGKLVIAHGEFGPDDENPRSREYEILRCWDVATGALRWTRQVSGDERSVRDLLLSPRGDGVVLVKEEGVELHDPETGEVTRSLPEWEQPLMRAALSPDGRHVFAAASGGRVVRWDLGEAK